MKKILLTILILFMTLICVHANEDVQIMPSELGVVKSIDYIDFGVIDGPLHLYSASLGHRSGSRFMCDRFVVVVSEVCSFCKVRR